MTTSRTITRPTPSIRASARAAPAGRNAVSTRPPSSGGTGSRLNTARTQLTASDARAAWWSTTVAAVASSGGGSSRSTNALAVASSRLVAGPASATRTATSAITWAPGSIAGVYRPVGGRANKLLRGPSGARASGRDDRALGPEPERRAREVDEALLVLEERAGRPPWPRGCRAPPRG